MTNWDIFLHNMRVLIMKGKRYGACEWCGKTIELATPNGREARRFCDRTCQNDAKSARNRRKYHEQKMLMVRRTAVGEADKVL